jgi:hypothetical protein
MPAFGFFKVQTSDNPAVFQSVGSVSFDFTPPAGGGSGTASLTYTPNVPGAPPQVVTLPNITLLGSFSGRRIWMCSGTVNPGLTIPASDPKAGTYTVVEAIILAQLGALWGRMFPTGAADGPTDDEVNWLASAAAGDEIRPAEEIEAGASQPAAYGHGA